LRKEREVWCAVDVWDFIVCGAVGSFLQV
jgi:hypothetical protein